MQGKWTSKRLVGAAGTQTGLLTALMTAELRRKYEAGELMIRRRSEWAASSRAHALLLGPPAMQCSRRCTRPCICFLHRVAPA